MHETTRSHGLSRRVTLPRPARTGPAAGAILALTAGLTPERILPALPLARRALPGFDHAADPAGPRRELVAQAAMVRILHDGEYAARDRP